MAVLTDQARMELRLTAEEFGQLEELSRASSVTKSEWIRQVIRMAAEVKRDQEKATKKR